MADDVLPELAGKVKALGEQPLAEHPDALEAVHRALVAELDRVGGWQHPSGDPPEE